MQASQQAHNTYVNILSYNLWSLKVYKLIFFHLILKNLFVYFKAVPFCFYFIEKKVITLDIWFLRPQKSYKY